MVKGYQSKSEPAPRLVIRPEVPDFLVIGEDSTELAAFVLAGRAALRAACDVLFEARDAVVTERERRT